MVSYHCVPKSKFLDQVILSVRTYSQGKIPKIFRYPLYYKRGCNWDSFENQKLSGRALTKFWTNFKNRFLGSATTWWTTTWAWTTIFYWLLTQCLGWKTTTTKTKSTISLSLLWRHEGQAQKTLAKYHQPSYPTDCLRSIDRPCLRPSPVFTGCLSEALSDYLDTIDRWWNTQEYFLLN